MTQKLGYGYQNLMTGQRPYSAAEEQALFDHFQAIRPGASLFLDNEGRALRAKALVSECAVVVRSYLDGEGDLYRNENASPQTVFNWYKNTPKGLIRNILNEPNSYVSDDDLKRLAHWCAEIADLFGNAGIPVVLPNFGEGHPDEKRLHLLEELWTALDKWHDLHFYGGHEYGSHLGMLWNGGDHKYDVFPWRVGRFEMFVAPYLKKHGHKIPNVILTEFGCDSAHDNTSFRGWKTCWTEKQYFDEIQAAITEIYTSPYYAGLCLFSWGNTGKPNTQDDWDTFDLSGAAAFHELLEASAKAVDVPKLIEKPANANNPKTVRVSDHAMHLRYGPGLSFKKINGDTAPAEIQTDDKIIYWEPYTFMIDREWAFTEVLTGSNEGKKGWMSVTDLKSRVTQSIPVITPAPPSSGTPIPVPTVPPSTTLPPDVTPSPDVSPKPYVFPVTITVTATDQPTAEAVIEWVGKLVRQQFVTLKASAAVAARIDDISDVDFEVQLPKGVQS